MWEVHPRRKCCTGYHFAAITLHESRRELTPSCPALSPVVKKKKKEKKKIYILGIGEKANQQEEAAPVTHTGELFVNEAEDRKWVWICTITSQKNIYIAMWIIIRIQYVICLNNLTTIFYNFPAIVIIAPECPGPCPFVTRSGKWNNHFKQATRSMILHLQVTIHVSYLRYHSSVQK